MKTVAEENQLLRPYLGNDRFQLHQRGPRIIGRQMHPAPRHVGGLLQMQVGDEQGSELRHEERARKIRDEIEPVEAYAVLLRQAPWPRR